METDSLICCICGGMLNDPKDLPCKHSCCKLCLMKYCLHNAESKSFPCPECKKSVPVPDQNKPLVEWVNFFPTNFDTIRKLDKMRLMESNAKQRKCVLCQQKWLTVNATKYCKACDENFCDECGNQHWLLRASKAHRIVLLTDIENQENDPLLRAQLLAMFNAKIKDKKHDKHVPKKAPLKTPQLVSQAAAANPNQDEHDCVIAGATFLTDGSILLVDVENKKLKLFDKNYRFVSSRFMSAWDVMRINPFYFAVTCPQDRRLKYFSIFDHEIEQEDEVPLDEECYGLCLLGEKIVVSCAGTPVTLRIFTTKDNVKTVALSAGKLKLVTPYYVAYDEANNIFIVSDIEQKCVKCFGESGQLIWEKPIPDGQGLTLYGNHILLARKTQHTVDLLNSDGQSLKSVVSSENGLQNPRSVCLETQIEDGPEDRLLVTDDTNIVRVFFLEDPMKEMDDMNLNIENNRLDNDLHTKPTVMTGKHNTTRVCSIL